MSASLRFSPGSLFGFPPLAGVLGLAGGGTARRARPAMPPRTGRGTYPQPAAPLAGDLDMDKLLSAAKTAPDLALLEWDGDRARTQPATPPAGAAAFHLEEDPQCLEPKRRKIRDRYISARFPGVARTAADLANSQHVIKAARLLFEDEQVELALELLELASEETPHESALWLARLELLFLSRDRDGFVASAREFRDAHPYHDAWAEIERLGRAIAPGEALFGAVSGPRDHEHYGPWPHTPNWIQAPWDLTAEIAASDFHRAMKRNLPRAA